MRIVDTNDNGEENTWFAGPYGSTRADQIAAELSHITTTRPRQCHVEPLFSDNDCLRVADYDHKTQGSLR